MTKRRHDFNEQGDTPFILEAPIDEQRSEVFVETKEAAKKRIKLESLKKQREAETLKRSLGINKANELLEQFNKKEIDEAELKNLAWEFIELSFNDLKYLGHEAVRSFLLKTSLGKDIDVLNWNIYNFNRYYKEDDDNYSPQEGTLYMKILSSIPHEELLGDHPKPVFCDHIVYSLEDIKERKSKILTNINHQKQQEEQSHKEPTLAFEETKDTNTDLNDLTISNHDAETQTYLLQEISNLNLSDKEYIIESHNNGTMDIIGD